MTATDGTQWGKAAASGDERVFLEGPRARQREFWHAVGICVEFIRGFRTLHFVGQCVTMFGSARLPEDHPYCVLPRQAGRELAGAGFTRGGSCRIRRTSC